MRVPADDFGAIRGLEFNKNSIWIRFGVSFLFRGFEFSFVLLIFVIIIKTRPERSSLVEDRGYAASMLLGTFSRDSELQNRPTVDEQSKATPQELTEGLSLNTHGSHIVSTLAISMLGEDDPCLR